MDRKLSIGLAIGFLASMAIAATMVVKVPSLSVSDTNYVKEAIFTNGVTIGGVRNTAWPSGGGFSGAVSNNVSSSGLLAVDATKTNGIAATVAHVDAAIGGGAITVGGFTNTSRTASTFVVAAADKSDTSSAASSVLANTLTNETGTGVAVFDTSPSFTTSLTLTNGSTGTIPVNINHASGGTADFAVLKLGSATRFQLTAAGVLRQNDGSANSFISPSSVRFPSTTQLGFVGTADGNGQALSAFWTWESAGTIQQGADAASPVAQVYKANDGSGTDKVGASLTIEGGQSTGTAAAGAVIIKTANSGGTSGASANAYSERFHAIPKWVTLTESADTIIFTVPVPATNYVGLTATVTVYATDGTDHQSLTTPITVDAVAKTTTITTVVSPTAVQTAVAASSGTLSVTYTVSDAGSNVLNVRCNAVSSLTQTVLRAKIVITAINSNGTAVITEQ